MTISIWNANATPGLDDYDTPGNWSAGVPAAGDTGFFATSNDTNIQIGSSSDVGAWYFSPAASQYVLGVQLSDTLRFVGAGIVIQGGSATIANIGIVEFLNFAAAGLASIDNGGQLAFLDFSTAGSSNITNSSLLGFFSSSSAGNAAISNTFAITFHEHSTAGAATIDNHFDLAFVDNSTAGSAMIYTRPGATTFFDNSADGGDARFITAAGGKVDFSLSGGPAGNNRLTVGSIAGAGTYLLGSDQLTVGENGLPMTVSGPVDDGGNSFGSGASLVKVGHGRLKLSHAGNTYSGGTTLAGGTLDLAALGAAGTGAITFAGHTRLKIENAALSGHAFGNAIDEFAKHDVVDLTGLHFHPGATATYHKAGHHLTVHSGSITVTLTLISPHGNNFEAVNDGHGGTEFLLHA